MHTGRIKTVNLNKGFGFIAVDGGPDAFFHCYDLPPELVFDPTLQERRVKFQIASTEKGDRARFIQPE